MTPCITIDAYKLLWYPYTTGTKEVKVLVDLAMIRATGQDDMEVERVSCLHAAATGYASLIYDLQEDADFHDLLECCKNVWRALATDKHLPKKLVTKYIFILLSKCK